MEPADSFPVKKKRGRPPKNPTEDRELVALLDTDILDDESIIQSQSDEAVCERRQPFTRGCNGKSLKPILNHFLGKEEANNEQQIVTRAKVHYRRDSLDENPEDSLKFKSQEKDSGFSSLERSADSVRKTKNNHERTSLDQDPDFEPKKHFKSYIKKVNSQDDYQNGYIQV